MDEDEDEDEEGSSNASTISDASQRRFSREDGPPQLCSTAMRSAAQTSRRAITPRAKRTRVGSGGGGDGGGCVAPDEDDEAIVLSEVCSNAFVCASL